ncbi:helix-turn-helix transcriptional regulator [Variovorax sp. CY25R-8]|uniref:helix-turn-helix transcriptional regulator n=1 Tax=Variovorax sp. CY25R-8 TaxID=2855501 RepID=UPI0021BB1C1D|nr:LuxR C-terminal-related transcriptional regulator [Variovorax sp. CY25R-8]MCT8173917.1 LuxR C-terminal-related transcriptional regulator [Variovorax sp. CY25R-8]
MRQDVDLMRALEAVRSIPDARASWRDVLATANTLVESDAAVMIVFEGDRVVDMQNFGADLGAMRDYAEHFHTEDVMTKPGVVRDPGTWLDTQQLIPEPLRQRNAYYVDFMSRHRMRQLYSYMVENGPGRRVSLGFQRAVASDALGERLRGARICGYSRALQDAMALRRARASSWLSVSDVAFDALDEASCLVHRNGLLVHASPRARALLDERRGLLQRKGHLAAADARLQARLEGGLAAACADGVVRTMAFPIAPGAGLLCIDVTKANPILRLAAEPLLFVRMRQEGVPMLASPEALAGALGVTGAEAAVLHALASGMKAADYATHRGLSIHTVRKQIAMMMGKLDCKRQVELVRIAMNVRDGC